MKSLFGRVGCCVVLVALIAGCAQQKSAEQTSSGAAEIQEQKPAASSTEAIDIGKQIQSADQKIAYLLAQAETFYASEKFQDTVSTVEYVLQYVDKDSLKAKDLLAKAKEKITAEIQSKAAGVKNNLLDLGK